MPFSVYVLRTSKNTLYTGYTNNLAKRLDKHKSGKGAKYLRPFESFQLVYTEIFATKNEAMMREAQIKKLTKIQKETIIRNALNRQLVL